MLALSFGLYGLFRKVAPVDGLMGATVESALLLPIAGCNGAGYPRELA